VLRKLIVDVGSVHGGNQLLSQSRTLGARSRRTAHCASYSSISSRIWLPNHCWNFGGGATACIGIGALQTRFANVLTRLVADRPPTICSTRPSAASRRAACGRTAEWAPARRPARSR
jgi:hypothetical protein